MDDVSEMILSEGIEDALEEAEGMSLVQLKELVNKRAAEQLVAPELLAAWAKHDEGRVR